ncbi:apolipo protein O-domain-containing protein [Biscogniauxia mediterranea]|nr:apolipo protein O-domain-containing protein [Biscogniauxia mediterranea]
MAARVLLRRRVVAPFMAATLAGGALFPSVALAEALPQDHHHSLKKPIYDDYETFLPKTRNNASSTPAPPSPSSDTATAVAPSTSSHDAVADSSPSPSPSLHSKRHGPTPTDRLAAQIGRARLFLYGYAAAAEDAVNSAVDSAFDLERSFTETVASLAPARETGERLMPGLVYVLVASMTGSIATRNRGLVLRAAVPFALGLGAGWLVLPVTMTNVSGLLWTYERRFPAVADAHLRARESLERAWHFAKVHADVSKTYVDEKVTTAREVVEEWVKQGK